MDLLDPLIKAIAARLIAAPIVGAFPSGVFQDVAPDKTSASQPFLVFNVLAAPRVLKYGGVQNANPRIQFAGYGQYDAAAAAMVIFTGVFEDLILTLTSGHNVNTMQMTEVVPRKDGTDPQGNDIWQFATEYSFFVSP